MLSNVGVSCIMSQLIASRLALTNCRYLLAIDGSTAAYRFAFLLATNSVVLKQVGDSPGDRLSTRRFCCQLQ